MANAIGGDRRIGKTEKALSRAYAELVRERGVGKVSVTELAERANIARKTFYLHYDTMEDFTYSLLMRNMESRIGDLAASFVPYGEQGFSALFENVATLLDESGRSIGSVLTDAGVQAAVSDLMHRCEQDLVNRYVHDLGVDEEDARLCVAHVVSGTAAVFARSYRGKGVSLAHGAELANAMRDASVSALVGMTRCHSDD